MLLPACRPEAQRGDPQPNVRGALRLDFRHGISNGRDDFQLTRARIEPAWRGRETRLTETLDWGDYRLSISDAGDRTLLFREGFDSPLDPAARAAMSQLSVRFPLPRQGVQAVVEKRRADSAFQQVWEQSIDPSGPDFDRSPLVTTTRTETLFASGDPWSKVDIAILGDGYREVEHAKFIADAKRATEYLFSVDPLRKRMRDFNVHAVFAASPESGVTDPYLGIARNSVLRCEYGSGEAERTLFVSDNNAMREAASSVPYDFVLVLANSRRYGGSAHFGGPAVVAIDSAASRYLVLHEFAHVIGGLAEEYYIPSAGGPAFTGNIEPWNPNVTIASATAKWRNASGAPPQVESWNKAEYEKYFAGYVKRYFALRNKRADEATVEAFMQQEMQRQAALLAKYGAGRKVGLFEGAHGYAKGAFRSEVSCIMFSLQTDHFCSACSAAIERMIDLHCR